jgi:hypothetical protein
MCAKTAGNCTTCDAWPRPMPRSHQDNCDLQPCAFCADGERRVGLREALLTPSSRTPTKSTPEDGVGTPKRNTAQQANDGQNRVRSGSRFCSLSVLRGLGSRLTTERDQAHIRLSGFCTGTPGRRTGARERVHTWVLPTPPLPTMNSPAEPLWRPPSEQHTSRRSKRRGRRCRAIPAARCRWLRGSEE